MGEGEREGRRKYLSSKNSTRRQGFVAHKGVRSHLDVTCSCLFQRDQVSSTCSATNVIINVHLQLNIGNKIERYVLATDPRATYVRFFPCLFQRGGKSRDTSTPLIKAFKRDINYCRQSGINEA